MNQIESIQPSTQSYCIDLHIHSSASDGTFSPREVVQMAITLQLKAIAITDHDTVAGIEEALDEAKNCAIEVIPGIEFSTEQDDISIHIIGLYVDYKDPKLLALTNEITNARQIRIQKIIDKINAMEIGPIITFEEIKELAGESIGRPHIGEILIKKRFVNNMNEAFEKFLNRNGLAYVPRFKLTPVEAVKFLRKMNAIPILAHPGFILESIDLDNFLTTLKAAGLVGIEVYYPTHTEEQIKQFKLAAKKHNLLESGGSDCHGLLNNGPFIGDLKLPYSLLEEIKKWVT